MSPARHQAIIRIIDGLLPSGLPGTLYYAFLYPYFNYCVEIWGNTYSAYMDHLIKLQKQLYGYLQVHLYRKFKLLELPKVQWFMHKRHHDTLLCIFQGLVVWIITFWLVTHFRWKNSAWLLCLAVQVSIITSGICFVSIVVLLHTNEGWRGITKYVIVCWIFQNDVKIISLFFFFFFLQTTGNFVPNPIYSYTIDFQVSSKFNRIISCFE